MKFLYAIAITLPLASYAGAALPQSGPAPSIATLPVERMCSGSGVLGHAFGETGVPGAGDGTGLSHTPLAPDFRPFEAVQITETKWTHRLSGARYRIYFEDPADARKVEAQLVARLGAAGWTGYEGKPAAVGLILYSDEAAWSAESGAIATVSVDGKALEFECTGVALAEAAMDEALGKLPAATARPLPPPGLAPPPIDPASCSSGSGQAAVEAILKGQPDGFMRHVMAQTDYRERLTQWKLDRLRKSGKYTEEQLLDFALAGLSAGQPDGDPARGVKDSFAPLMAMFDEAPKVEALRKAGDRAGFCRGALRMLGAIKQIEAVVLPQWQAMHDAIDAEAKRAGISLE